MNAGEVFKHSKNKLVSVFSDERYFMPLINNRKIGKVNHLHNRIEPFPALFWALGIVLAHILQLGDGLASLKRGTGTVLYGRGQLGSI